MAYTSIRPLLEAAKKGKFALGAFNMNSITQIEAAIDIHDSLHSGAILQGAELSNAFMAGGENWQKATLEEKKIGAERLAKAVRKKAESVDIPIALHLDHGKSFEMCKICVDAGYSSVMIDASQLPYEQNVELTREVVKYAHAQGVSVEAELGVLSGVEDDVVAQLSTYTNPLTALDFVKKTGVDLLAISYGTSHGANKGTDVKLRKTIAVATNELFLHEKVDCGLVSHGSSSVPNYLVESINNLGGNIKGAAGVPASELQPVIQEGGICKINVDTDIRLAVTNNIRKMLKNNPEMAGTEQGSEIVRLLKEKPDQFDPRYYAGPIINFIMTGETGNKFEKAIRECFYKGTVEALVQNMSIFGQIGSSYLIESKSRDDLKQYYQGF